MEESQSRIEGMAREGSTSQALVARRILEDIRLYRQWEAEHERLMRTVAERAARCGRRWRFATRASAHPSQGDVRYLRQHKITGAPGTPCSSSSMATGTT
jgi:hypothetical protein